MVKHTAKKHSRKVAKRVSKVKHARSRALAAGGCGNDGGTMREIRGKERAVERSIGLLTEAQEQLDWDCGMDPRGSICTHAKANLEKVTDLVLQEQRELDEAMVESCL